MTDKNEPRHRHRLTQGMVELPREATCRFIFKTPSDQLPKIALNETTYYGVDMVIPIKNSFPKTTISPLEGDREFDNAKHAFLNQSFRH